MKRILITLLCLALFFSFASCDNSDKKTGAAEINIGDTVEFGKYEQNPFKSGAEKLQWIVVDKKDDSALFLSKYAIDFMSFNDAYGSVTWETCSLRKWLNGDFYDKSFSNQEKDFIISTTIQNEDNPRYLSSGGNPTKDKIFIPGVEDVYKTINSFELRMCEPTPYAIEKGKYFDINYEDNIESCDWLLRTPGESTLNICWINCEHGELNMGNRETTYELFVRPMLWISYKNNNFIKKVFDTEDIEKPTVIVTRSDGSEIMLLKHESLLITETINNITSWENNKFKGTKTFQLHVDGKYYFYNQDSGLIGYEKTTYLEGEQKEFFDRVINCHLPKPYLVPPTTVASSPATD